MNDSALKKEILYGILFLIVALITGLVTSWWILSLLLWSLIYILWKWVELYYFYKWYKKGANKDTIPVSHGIWEEFSCLVTKNNSHNKKIEKRNKFLIDQFETMAQALPYAAVLLNKRHEIIWANQTSAQILNVDNAKDHHSKVDNIIRNPVFTAMLKSDSAETDAKITHPNEPNKRIYLKLIKLSNKRYLLVGRDISQQDALRQSRKAFVDNASHELRTPLTVITGYLEMLHNADDIPHVWHSAISQAEQQSQRMEKIINDMLKLSSIEHERYMEDNDEIINMPQLLNRLFNDVKNSSSAQKHLFSANIDSALKLTGNIEEITSICLNLLNNAVIHTKPGTQIILRWYLEDNRAFLEICDNGQGIKAKHIPHLSERFYRVDNAKDKNTNSTGLGLAIVKQICDNHNAELKIESTEGKGTCFTVVFPSVRVKT